MRHAYPMLLDVTDRLVVIIGGGSVAVRKAQGLLAAGAARVRCVALNFHERMPGEVERVEAPFSPEQLEGACLVFAATDSPAVNEAVVREAHRRGMLVNRADADDAEPGDFSTPALWRGEAVMITVSAGGNPALAVKIRDDLSKKIDPAHVAMAAAMRELRPLIRGAAGMDPARRREAFYDLAGQEAMKALAEGGVEAVRSWLGARYPEIGGKSNA